MQFCFILSIPKLHLTYTLHTLYIHLNYTLSTSISSDGVVADSYTCISIRYYYGAFRNSLENFLLDNVLAITDRQGIGKIL